MNGHEDDTPWTNETVHAHGDDHSVSLVHWVWSFGVDETDDPYAPEWQHEFHDELDQTFRAGYELGQFHGEHDGEHDDPSYYGTLNYARWMGMLSELVDGLNFHDLIFFGNRFKELAKTVEMFIAFRADQEARNGTLPPGFIVMDENGVVGPGSPEIRGDDDE